MEGVTGLVGLLADAGSELASLVRFFFKNPRGGIKSALMRLPSSPTGATREGGGERRRSGGGLADDASLRRLCRSVGRGSPQQISGRLLPTGQPNQPAILAVEMP